MRVADKHCSQDQRLESHFGAPVSDLYEQAATEETPAAVRRAMELRSFLALAEEQVARFRDRVHAATDPSRDMDELSAHALRIDAQWMETALSARDGYLTALNELLKAMPPPARPGVRFAQPTITATTLPAPTHAMAGRGRRP